MKRILYMCVDNLAYFDRYHNVSIFQIQAADDEFFLPDSEAND